jgi:hypothetical protein
MRTSHTIAFEQACSGRFIEGYLSALSQEGGYRQPWDSRRSSGNENKALWARKRGVCGEGQKFPEESVSTRGPSDGTGPAVKDLLLQKRKKIGTLPNRRLYRSAL